PVTLTLDRDLVLPDLSPPSLSLVSMVPSWDGAIGRLTLVVGVGLPAWVGTGRLDWSVDADDRRLGSGSVALDADRHLVLEVAVDPAAMAATSWDAWRGRLTRLHVEARGSVETGYGVLPLSLVRDLVVTPAPG